MAAKAVVAGLASGANGKCAMVVLFYLHSHPGTEYAQHTPRNDSVSSLCAVLALVGLVFVER